MAEVVVDIEQDLAIVVATNFPGEGANEAAGRILEVLYTHYVAH
jgi:hypothetical protein